MKYDVRYKNVIESNNARIVVQRDESVQHYRVEAKNEKEAKKVATEQLSKFFNKNKIQIFNVVELEE